MSTRVWRYVVGLAVGALIGLGCSIVVSLVTSPAFSATALLVVSGSTGPVSIDASGRSTDLQSSLLARQRVRTYEELVFTDRVMKPIRDKYGSEFDSSRAEGKVYVSSEPGATVIRIEVLDRSPERVVEVVNELARSLVSVSSELERPVAVGDESPAVSLSVFSAAGRASPSETEHPILDIALSVTIGAILGYLALSLADLNEGAAVRSGRIASSLAGGPDLGHFRLTSSGAWLRPNWNGAVTDWSLEPYRKLGIAMRFVDIVEPCKIMAVATPVERGVSSVIIADLALALTRSGSRVLVVDADLNGSILTDLLGVSDQPGLTAVLAGQCTVEGAVVSRLGVDFLPGGRVPPSAVELLGSRRMGALLELLANEYDRVLVACGGLLYSTGSVAAAWTDGVMIVCAFGDVRARDLRLTAARLELASVRIAGTVLVEFESSPRSIYSLIK